MRFHLFFCRKSHKRTKIGATFYIFRTQTSANGQPESMIFFVLRDAFYYNRVLIEHDTIFLTRYCHYLAKEGLDVITVITDMCFIDFCAEFGRNMTGEVANCQFLCWRCQKVVEKFGSLLAYSYLCIVKGGTK